MKPRSSSAPPELPARLGFDRPLDAAGRAERRRWCTDNGVSFLRLLQEHYAAVRALRRSEADR